MSLPSHTVSSARTDKGILMIPLQTNAYSVCLLLRTPSAPPIRFTCLPDSKSIGEWIEFLFSPVGASEWAGCFRKGPMRTRYTDVITTPSESHCCVIADGQGYVVDVLQPQRTVVMPGEPITAVYDADGQQVMVLASPTTLIGVMGNGHWWISRRLASDGIRNVIVRGKSITGEGWQAHSDEWVTFVLDSTTGHALRK